MYKQENVQQATNNPVQFGLIASLLLFVAIGFPGNPKPVYKTDGPGPAI